MPTLKQLQRALKPHLGDRTDAVLQEGLTRLRLQPDNLEGKALASLLKRFVYLELQRSMSAPAARKIVEDTLASLQDGEAAPAIDSPGNDPEARLQKAISRFSLYFEWPEVQRLRSLAALIAASKEEGQPADDLLRKASEQIDLLDEKLQNELLRQARDISDLEEALQRVKSIGGPKLRRLASLLKQIKEAQASETLATAEVERARKLAADLRKLVESSVVQNATLVPEDEPATAEDDSGVILVDEGAAAQDESADGDFELLIDFDNLEPEVADRIREIDLAEEQRRLERLKSQYAAVLETEAVSKLLGEIEAALAAGQLAGGKMDELQAAMEEAVKEALAEARARYEWLSERLRSVERDGAVTTGMARSQLELIKESLEMGIIPGDLGEAEKQVLSLEEALKEHREEEKRRLRLQGEAESLIKSAHDSLAGSELPELQGFRERLALLESGVEAGEIDEALLGRLKTELPEALSLVAREGEAAKALRAKLTAQLEALPELPEITDTRNSLLLQLAELPPEQLQEEVAALEGKARQLIAQGIERLRERVQPYQLTVPELEIASKEFQRGQLPNLPELTQKVEATISARRSRLEQQLQELAAAAKRLEGLGGEKLLAEISKARSYLASGQPDLEPLRRELRELQKQRESLRLELSSRFESLNERYQKAKAVGGETAYRAGSLMGFLEKGIARIDRLGSKGLREVERALNEGDRLISQLEEEHAAAKQVAAQLQGADLDDLLGVFDSPASPAKQDPAVGREAIDEPSTEEAAASNDILEPLRIRGVLWARLIKEGETASEFDPALLQALTEDLAFLGEEVGYGACRDSVISLPQHALLIAPRQQGQVVVLAERAVLSRLVTLIDRHLPSS